MGELERKAEEDRSQQRKYMKSALGFGTGVLLGSLLGTEDVVFTGGVYAFGMALGAAIISPRQLLEARTWEENICGGGGCAFGVMVGGAVRDLVYYGGQYFS